MSEPSAPSAPAGWYQDPQNPSVQRYWDGQQWVAAVADVVSAPEQPGVAPTAKPKPVWLRWWFITGVAVVGLLVIGGVAAALSPKTKPAAAPAAASVPSSTPAPAPTLSDLPDTPIYDVPKPADFKLTVKVTSKQCFGSAGCNVEYKVLMTIVNDVTFDPSTTYDVTFNVRGDEDGPIIDTTEVTGTEYTVPEGSASTPSSATKLTAVVTSVDSQ